MILPSINSSTGFRIINNDMLFLISDILLILKCNFNESSATNELSLATPVESKIFVWNKKSAFFSELC